MYPKTILTKTVAISALIGSCASASAQGRPEYTTCQNSDPRISIPACSAIIDDPRESLDNRNRALDKRARAHGTIRELDRAIADFDALISRNPSWPGAYSGRALAHMQRGNPERVIEDAARAIQQRPEDSMAHALLGDARAMTCDFDRAVRDFDEAIRLKADMIAALQGRAAQSYRKDDLSAALRDLEAILIAQPTAHLALNLRGLIHAKQNRLDAALADFDRAIDAKRDFGAAYNNRGLVHARQGRIEKALQDFDAAVRLAATVFVHRFNRGKAYQQMGRRDLALADFRSSLELAPPRCGDDKAQRNDVRWRIGSIQADIARDAERPRVRPEATGPAIGKERRVALVIGNERYRSADALRNPVNDAKAVAATLRRLGFDIVEEASDVGRTSLLQLLEKFSREAASADWAVVFYSGHGLQIDRTSYLVPVDARVDGQQSLDRDLVTLDAVLHHMAKARVLRLVILDACRDNPLLRRISSTATPSSTLVRGLSRADTTAGTLVAYAAREGQVADDGRGLHSPYTQALLSHLEEPGVDVEHMLRKVRDAVMQTTRDREWRDPKLLGPQQPYTTGSLPSAPLCFKQPCRAN